MSAVIITKKCKLTLLELVRVKEVQIDNDTSVKCILTLGSCGNNTYDDSWTKSMPQCGPVEEPWEDGIYFKNQFMAIQIFLDQDV